MEIGAGTLLTSTVVVPIDDKNPCTVTLARIDITIPVTIVWVLPKGYQFKASGVGGLGEPDFHDGRFDGLSRRRYRWTARSSGSQVERNYSLSFEWIDDQGVLKSCVVPDLKIINKS